MTRQPVAVVSGGGAGIGAAIAEALGRDGVFVVTVDPNVSLDGTGKVLLTEPSTADRIVAAGGRARAVDLSVTDGPALTALCEALVEEFDGLDAIVNAAGISRPTSFASGEWADWDAVLAVHLGGYLNVLQAGLAVMGRRGRGTIVGLTSGAGWRLSDGGAYSCAKRAVASLTWQMARLAPAGVTVTALSPIAATRMVAAGLARAAAATTNGGLDLSGFPTADRLGPIGALLAGGGAHLHGRVFFSAGAEVVLVAEPSLIEMVRSRPVADLAGVIDEIGPVLAEAEASQSTSAGLMARFTELFDQPSPDPLAAPSATCLVSCADTSRRVALIEALTARGVRCLSSEATDPEALTGELSGELDGIVVWCTDDHRPNGPGDDGWAGVIDDHAELPRTIRVDAAWSQVMASTARSTGRVVRLVMLVDATRARGRSRAQALTQLSRSARTATDGLVTACVVSCESAHESDRHAAAAFGAYLASSSVAETLSGAELCVGAGWLGLRAHPRPTAAVSYGGPDLPDWVGSAVALAVTGGDVDG